jgi:hypothetical protein
MCPGIEQIQQQDLQPETVLMFPTTDHQQITGRELVIVEVPRHTHRLVRTMFMREEMAMYTGGTIQGMFNSVMIGSGATR